MNPQSKLHSVLISKLDDPDNEDKLILRLKHKTKDAIKEFTESFGELSKTKWNYKQSDNKVNGAVHVSYKVVYECSYSGRRQKPDEEKKKIHS